MSGTISSQALPVELTSFGAALDGSDVVLRWETASETNNSGFEVQRKAAGVAAEAWEVVTFVEGHGTTLDAQDYQHRIEDLAPGRHVFRLKQIDYDGAFEYSDEVEVQVALEDAFLLTPAYPNPFRDHTQFSLSVAERQHVEVSVFDVTGRRVAQLLDGPVSGGQKTLTWWSGGLPSGLYVIRTVGETFSDTQKVTLLR